MLIPAVPSASHAPASAPGRSSSATVKSFAMAPLLSRSGLSYARPRPLSTESGGERDELEPIDVHEAPVGDLKLRDHGEGKEGHGLEGRLEPAAERPRGLDARSALLDDLIHRLVGEKSCHRQGHAPPDPAGRGH